MRLIALPVILLLSIYSAPSRSSECVILLHGLARSASSMSTLADTLTQHGYYTANIDYPSRKLPIEQLAELAVSAGLEQCDAAGAAPVNIVTHSLGGILVRQYYASHDTQGLHRVVMLGPPNNGSEAVDNLKALPGFKLLNGPAGMQLGTDEKAITAQLGAVNFDLGVIAGTQSINLILSAFLPNPDDGKVSVASTKIEGMCGFVALPTSHPFMMKNDLVISEVIAFLQFGQFNSETALSNTCNSVREP